MNTSMKQHVAVNIECILMDISCMDVGETYTFYSCRGPKDSNKIIITKIAANGIIDRLKEEEENISLFSEISYIIGVVFSCFVDAFCLLKRT